MKKNKVILFIASLLISKLAFAANNLPYPSRIASGSKLGLYYTVADNICYIQDHISHKNICDPLESKGSLENIKKVKDKNAEFGIVQFNHLYAETKTDPNTSIRELIKLYPEELTIIIKKNSDIWSITDLAQGKKIVFGASGGAKSTVEHLFKIANVKNTTSEFMLSIPSVQVTNLLCDGEVDAVAFLIAHPNAMVQEIAKECEIRILPLSDDLIKRAHEAYPFYSRSVIRDGIYPGILMPVFTISTDAVMITHKDIENDVVYKFVANIVNNVHYLRKSHLILDELNVNTIRPDGQLAPIHPAVVKFFEEYKRTHDDDE